MKNIKKILFPLLFCLLFIWLHFVECKSEWKAVPAASQPDSLVTIRFSVIGDLMCHTPQYLYAKTGEDTYDFNSTFREVKKYFAKSDFLLANFETVLGGKGKEYSGYPMFNTPDAFAVAVKNAGFNLLSTANNHAFDQGEKGVLRTIDILNKYGLNYNGTFSTNRDRDSIRIFNVKGIKIAFLAYSYGTNGNPVPKNKPYLINLIDFNLIKKDIAEARKLGTDLVIVHYHFGIEYQREPVQAQKDIVDKTIKLGADIIIGGHPHVIEPVNYYKTVNGKLDTGFVAYSMGNFVSNQQKRYTDVGLVLSLSLTKNFRNGSLSISDADYVPAWVFKGQHNGKNEFIVLPAAKSSDVNSYGFLNSNDKARFKQAFEDTRDIITKYTHKIHLYGEK